MDEERPDLVCNWTYFFDFLDVFKARNADHADTYWKHVLTEVRLAQRSSPSFPELVPLGEGLYRFFIDNFPNNSNGLIVVVDFEMDKNGIIEPVMGGSNQD